MQHIRTENLPVRVLVISAFGDAQSLRSAVESGADGFALKTDSPEIILAASRQVAERREPHYPQGAPHENCQRFPGHHERTT